jgi:hypothetical protein
MESFTVYHTNWLKSSPEYNIFQKKSMKFRKNHTQNGVSIKVSVKNTVVTGILYAAIKRGGYLENAEKIYFFNRIICMETAMPTIVRTISQ